MTYRNNFLLFCFHADILSFQFFPLIYFKSGKQFHNCLQAFFRRYALSLALVKCIKSIIAISTTPTTSLYANSASKNPVVLFAEHCSCNFCVFNHFYSSPLYSLLSHSAMPSSHFFVSSSFILHFHFFPP